MMIEFGGAALGKKVAGSLLGVSMGVCQLPAGGTSSDAAMSGIACLRVRPAVDLVGLPGSGDSPLTVASLAGSIGIHLSPWVSLQAKGSIRETNSFDRDSTDWALMPDGVKKRTEHAVVRLGNPALNRFRVAMGNQRLPFGIDGNPADDAWLVMEDRTFWGFSSRGVSLAYDNLLDLQLEAGISGQGMGEKLDSGSGESMPGRSAARLTYDLGFFERARVVVSVADDLDRMRYGLGFLSSLRNGDLTHFELLRSSGEDRDLDAGFRRLFRFAYQTADRRWWFLYDDDRLRARTFALGYRHFIVSPASSGAGVALKFAFGGVRSLNTIVEGKAMLTTGVEASL